MKKTKVKPEPRLALLNQIRESVREVIGEADWAEIIADRLFHALNDNRDVLDITLEAEGVRILAGNEFVATVFWENVAVDLEFDAESPLVDPGETVKNLRLLADKLEKSFAASQE
jgi:hypothetical protein